MDTIRLRATFSLHHTEPTVFFTDGISVPFSIRHRGFLWWKQWELVGYQINQRGRVVKRVVARHKCPVNLLVQAQEMLDDAVEQRVAEERARIANAKRQFAYWQTESEDL